MVLTRAALAAVLLEQISILLLTFRDKSSVAELLSLRLETLQRGSPQEYFSYGYQWVNKYLHQSSRLFLTRP